MERGICTRGQDWGECTVAYDTCRTKVLNLFCEPLPRLLLSPRQSHRSPRDRSQTTETDGRSHNSLRARSPDGSLEEHANSVVEDPVLLSPLGSDAVHSFHDFWTFGCRS